MLEWLYWGALGVSVKVFKVQIYGYKGILNGLPFDPRIIKCELPKKSDARFY
jgi:hypothetical protein